MLTKKKGYRQPEFIINDTRVAPKKKLKYLGIELCKKLGYGTHIRGAAVKAGRTASALERILPNVRGERQDKRKILATTVQNKLLYGAPIWADALQFENNVKMILGPQRKIALRTAMEYRMVSMSAGTIPIHLMASERQKKYRQIQESVATNEKELRACTLKEWQKNGIRPKQEDGRGD